MTILGTDAIDDFESAVQDHALEGRTDCGCFVRGAEKLVIINGYTIAPGQNLYEADLYEADIRKANLYKANLCRADLCGADLCQANLYGADLSFANLGKADLYGADLTRANLSGADLGRANLSGANLYGSDLRGAHLYEANFGRAILGRTILIDAGQEYRGYRFVGVPQDNEIMISAGCRWFTLAEALEHWKDNPEALAKVRMIQAVAEIRGPHT